jgi:hypothetical protein
MSWLSGYSRNSTYGYPQERWKQAKSRAREIMVQRITEPRLTISYGDLSREIQPIIDFLSPHNPHFHYMLGQISEEEDDQNRGLLSAIVVHSEDGHPGHGWWELAEARGRDVTDREKCWIDEVRRLQAVHISS